MHDAIAPTHTDTRRISSPQHYPMAHRFLIICSVLITAITVLFLLGLCLIQLIMVPRFIEIFADFDMQLPSLTISVISTPSAVYLALYGFGIIGLIVKDCIPQVHPGIKIAINLIVILLCIVMYFTYFFSLYLPMNALMESLM